MILPKLPHPGDTVFLIAPSSPFRNNTAEECRDGLEALGYKVVLGDSVHGHTEKGYAAAPAEVRAADLHRAFSDPAVDAIWAIRGGSMGCEVLPLLDRELISSHPKALFGFSDISALHAYLQGKCGMVSFHAPNASSFIGNKMNAYAWKALESVLTMRDSVEFRNSDSHPVTVIKDGHAEGELVGGNLTVVNSLNGTEYAVNTKGRVLFLEDVDEDVYRLDRMLTQMKLCGLFEDAAGLLFGDFTDAANSYNPDYTPECLLRDFFADYNKPVYCNLTVGHIAENGTLPLGMRCVMDGGRITFHRD